MEHICLRSVNILIFAKCRGDYSIFLVNMSVHHDPDLNIFLGLPIGHVPVLKFVQLHQNSLRGQRQTVQGREGQAHASHAQGKFLRF
jgi:hypothetical protein